MSTFTPFSAPHLFYPCPPEGEISGMDFVTITETQAVELRFLLEDLEMTFEGTATVTNPSGTLGAEWEDTMAMSSGVSGADFWQVRGDAGDAYSTGGGDYPIAPADRVCEINTSGDYRSPAFFLEYSDNKTSGGISGSESGGFYMAIRSVSGQLRLYYSLSGNVGRSDGVRTISAEILSPSTSGTISPRQLATSGTVSIAGVTLQWEAWLPRDRTSPVVTTHTLTGAGLTLTPTYYTPA